MTEEEKPDLTLIEGGAENTTASDIDGAFLGGRIIYEENKVVLDDGTELPYKTDELPEGWDLVEGTAEVIQSSPNQNSKVNLAESDGTGIDVGEQIIPSPEQMVGALVQEVSFALMKWWFPNRLPVGDDYQRWVEISLKDAEAVVTHLMTVGIIKLEKNDEPKS